MSGQQSTPEVRLTCSFLETDEVNSRDEVVDVDASHARTQPVCAAVACPGIYVCESCPMM